MSILYGIREESVFIQKKQIMTIVIQGIPSNSAPPVMPPGAQGFLTQLSSISSRSQMVLLGWQKKTETE